MPSAGEWRKQAAALRERARIDPQASDRRRQTLLMLAEDCEEIASNLETVEENGGPLARG